MMKRVAIALTLALALVGCSKQEEETTELEAPEEEVGEEEVAEDEVAEAEPPDAEELPIPEDFTDEASEDVTADNYKQKLAAMEEELEDTELP